MSGWRLEGSGRGHGGEGGARAAITDVTSTSHSTLRRRRSLSVRPLITLCNGHAQLQPGHVHANVSLLASLPPFPFPLPWGERGNCPFFRVDTQNKLSPQIIDYAVSQPFHTVLLELTATVFKDAQRTSHFNCYIEVASQQVLSSNDYDTCNQIRKHDT